MPLGGPRGWGRPPRVRIAGRIGTRWMWRIGRHRLRWDGSRRLRVRRRQGTRGRGRGEGDDPGIQAREDDRRDGLNPSDLLPAVPAGLSDTHAGIAFEELPAHRGRHRADHFPPPQIVVEANQGRLLARGHAQAGGRAREIGEADGNRLIEVFGAVRLHRDVQDMLDAGRERFGKAIRRHGGKPHPSAALTGVAVERVGGNPDFDPRVGRVRSDHGGRKRNHGLRRRRHRLERVGGNQRQVDDAAAVGEVRGDAGNGSPRLADIRVVGTIWPVAVVCRAPVHVNEEPPGGCRLETEEARGVCGRTQRFLRAVHRDGHAFERVVGESSGSVRHALAGVHVTDHGRPTHRGDAQGVEVDVPHAPGLTVARQVQPPSKVVPRVAGIKGDPHPRTGREVLEGEERHRPAIR